MATATIHICDICGAEDKKQTEFKLKVFTSEGKVVREMDLCIACNENLGKLITEGKPQSPVKPPKKEKKKPAIDLVKDVFTPVVERVKERSDELKGLQKRRLHAFYLASWLNEVIMEALKDSDVNPQQSSNGSDINFVDQSKLALKGSSSGDFDWVAKEEAVKPGVPVLFLASGKDKETIGNLSFCSEIKVLTCEYLNDGEDDWIIGLIRRA